MMKLRNQLYPQQVGFSLIELMIAMLLGIVVIAGVFSVFIGSSQTYRLQDAMFRAQESGRFALTMIVSDARHAGFQDVLPEEETRLADKLAVTGYTAADADKPAAVVSGVSSDVLHIRSHDGRSNGDVAYYIANDVDNQPALFMNGNAAVEGVEGLVVLYGRDTDGDREADQFDSLAAVPDWGDVVAIRLNLYVASGDPGLLDTAQAAMAAPFDAVDTSDLRLYQAYSSTVALRNKMP
jgi:type IV pilus assembly protein PilW